MAETTSRCCLSDQGPALTRSKLLSKSKALLAARSVLHSYLGSAVMYNQTREMNVYQLQLRRLQSETTQRLRTLEQSRTQFVMLHCRPLVVSDVSCCRRVAWTAAGGRWRQTAPVTGDLDGPDYVKPTPRTAHSAPIKPASNAFRRLTIST